MRGGKKTLNIGEKEKSCFKLIFFQDVLNFNDKVNHRNKTTVSEHSKTLMLGQCFRAHHKDHTAVYCPSKKNISVDSCTETPLNPDYTRLGEDSSEDAMNITSKTNNKGKILCLDFLHVKHDLMDGGCLIIGTN